MILMSRALAVLYVYVMLNVPLCGSERAPDQKSGALGFDPGSVSNFPEASGKSIDYSKFQFPSFKRKILL